MRRGWDWKIFPFLKVLEYLFKTTISHQRMQLLIPILKIHLISCIFNSPCWWKIWVFFISLIVLLFSQYVLNLFYFRYNLDTRYWYVLLHLNLILPNQHNPCRLWWLYRPCRSYRAPHPHPIRPLQHRTLLLVSRPWSLKTVAIASFHDYRLVCPPNQLFQAIVVIVFLFQCLVQSWTPDWLFRVLTSLFCLVGL